VPNFVLARCIDLSLAKEPELQQLSQACDPATFGLGSQDVRDDTVRKAQKLDVRNFAPKFSPAESGLTGIIYADLFKGLHDQKTIEAELYKLNVYGSFLSVTLTSST
jgi:hypothetical protein